MKSNRVVDGSTAEVDSGLDSVSVANTVSLVLGLDGDETLFDEVAMIQRCR